MNANEMTPKCNIDRLHRIKIVSRIVRYVIIGLFVFSVGSTLLFGGFPAWRLEMFNYPRLFAWCLLASLFQVVMWAWYWKLAKLFQYYERGLIFATESIRCIKVLGVLCVLGWFMSTDLYLISVHDDVVLQPNVALPHVTVSAPTTVPALMKNAHSFKVGFFGFSVDGVNFGLLLNGIIVVIFGWIMDEGRKIQEEQELTV